MWLKPGYLHRPFPALAAVDIQELDLVRTLQADRLLR
jgi:hypothetical protein